MNSETNIQTSEIETEKSSEKKNLNRLKIVAALFTLLGVGLFAYFIYSVGIDEILAGIEKFGFGGFLLIQAIYFFRVSARASALKLCVH